MEKRPRRTVALALAALLLIGVGAGMALAQTQTEEPSASPSLEEVEGSSGSRDAFLDGVAERLGIDRSTLEVALEAQALADVQWAQDNGFLSEDEADAIRERIQSDESEEAGGRKEHGRFRSGHGLPFFGFRGGHVGRAGGLLAAAADYLEVSLSDLLDALDESTLAEVAADQGKSVDGLITALVDEVAAELEIAVNDERITGEQRDALLDRFSEQAADIVNGVSPGAKDLAERLDVTVDELVAAIKGTASDEVDDLLQDGRITEAQAEAIKQRIESASGLSLGGLGPCGGLRGLGFGLGFGVGFGHHRGEGLLGP